MIIRGQGFGSVPFFIAASNIGEGEYMLFGMFIVCLIWTLLGFVAMLLSRDFSIKEALKGSGTVFGLYALIMAGLTAFAFLALFIWAH